MEVKKASMEEVHIYGNIYLYFIHLLPREISTSSMEVKMEVTFYFVKTNFHGGRTYL